MTHQPIVAWTEIPVTDMKKGCAFYGDVFGWKMKIISAGPNDIAVFNGAVVGAGGHLYPGQLGESGWKKQAANLLKSELKRKGVTYAQLADLFCEKEVNILNKLLLGKFSAAFLIQSMAAIVQSELRL
jgi:hypothetical protein